LKSVVRMVDVLPIVFVNAMKIGKVLNVSILYVLESDKHIQKHAMHEENVYIQIFVHVIQQWVLVSNVKYPSVLENQQMTLEFAMEEVIVQISILVLIVNQEVDIQDLLVKYPFALE